MADDGVVSKQDAVRRQMEVAVSLYLEHRDPLPVYALTSGAYSILKDISKARAKRHGAERERLVAEGKADEMLWLDANRPAEQRASITISNMNLIRLQLGDEKPGPFWNKFHARYNFLKHATAGEDEVLGEDIPWSDTETLLLACALAYEEMGFPRSEPIRLFRDHCYAQRGLFDQCSHYQFRPTYHRAPMGERLAAVQKCLGFLGDGVEVAVVG